MIQFLESYGRDIAYLTGQHLMLTAIAMLIACVMAIPLGVVLARTRWRRLASATIALVSLVQPIPSLALVALAAVAFLALGLSTIGMGPALLALVAYALLPVLRNTYTGIRQVDPTIVEVATGMGMRSWQVLLRVQLPLALPVIMTGIRIATVWTIGVATLVSYIGAHSLGDLISRGLSNNRPSLILAGALPAIALALAFDWGLALLEKSLSADRQPDQTPSS